MGVLYDRVHSREISSYGGVVKTMPWFAFFFVFFAMANVGLPGTSGFVGEFLVILGVFSVNGWYAAVAATTLVLGAAYTLWMIKRVVFGPVANKEVEKLSDITPRESWVLASIGACVLLMGLWPVPLLELMRGSVAGLMTLASVSKY